MMCGGAVEISAVNSAHSDVTDTGPGPPDCSTISTLLIPQLAHEVTAGVHTEFMLCFPQQLFTDVCHSLLPRDRRTVSVTGLTMSTCVSCSLRRTLPVE